MKPQLGIVFSLSYCPSQNLYRVKQKRVLILYWGKALNILQLKKNILQLSVVLRESVSSEDFLKIIENILCVYEDYCDFPCLVIQ